MKFEERTTGNIEYRIYAQDGGGKFSIHGAVKEDGEWLNKIWLSNGKFLESKLSNYDLTPIWQPKNLEPVWVKNQQDIEWLPRVAAGYAFYVYDSGETEQNVRYDLCKPFLS